MLLLCEGVMFFAGLFFLISGRARFGGSKVVQGDRARVIGILLLLPGPIAIIMGVLSASAARSQAEFINTASTLARVELLLVSGGLIAARLVYARSPGEVVSAQVITAPVADVTNVLTLPEAAAYLRVSESEVETMIADGRLKAIQIGSQYRISRAVIDAMLNP